MKKLGAATLLSAVILGAGVAAPATAAQSAAAKVVTETTVASVFGIWPQRG